MSLPVTSVHTLMEYWEEGGQTILMSDCWHWYIVLSYGMKDCRKDGGITMCAYIKFVSIMPNSFARYFSDF